MPVRGSPNYVWFTEQPLGSGASGNVYFGRHKRLGEVCAVKVFADLVRSSHIQVKTRELEMMRKLNHPNIVRLLAIEQESHTKENVLIMELCSEGSVYDLLTRPENSFGFPEAQFIEFFRDFVLGLEYLRLHGIIHRDIKPGNILCSKLEDGRLVYKLTDFGAARELDDGEQFMSMYGTEEYLHPDVYGCAILGTMSRNRTMFDASVDVWSMGATLYHVATGQLPFQSFGGRSNKETMFKMITDKPKGTVAALQRVRGGSIEYQSDFPDTCPLSSGLRKHLVPMIAGSLEPNTQQQLSFEQFFEKAKHLNSCKVYHVQYMETFVLHRIYLAETETFDGFQLNIQAQTEVAKTEQMLIFNERIISDSLKSEDVVAEKFQTTEEHPISLLHLPDSNHVAVGICKILPTLPTAPVDGGTEPNMAADATWSRDACAHLIYLYRVMRNSIQAQLLLNAIIHILCMALLDRFEHCKVQFSNTQEYLRTVSTSINLLHHSAVHSPSLGPDKDSGLGSSVSDSGVESHTKRLVPPLKTSVYASLLTAKKHMNELQRLERLDRHLTDQIGRFNVKELEIEIYKQIQPACVKERCDTKLKTLVDQSKQTWEKFRKDRKTKLSYNDSQVHKYDKIKLDEILRKKAGVNFDKHCFPAAQKAIDDFTNWLCNTYKKYVDDIHHIERDLNKLYQMTRDLASSVTQVSLHGQKPVGATHVTMLAPVSLHQEKPGPPLVTTTLTGTTSPSSDYFSAVEGPEQKLQKNMQKTKLIQENTLALSSEVIKMLELFRKEYSLLTQVSSSATHQPAS